MTAVFSCCDFSGQAPDCHFPDTGRGGSSCGDLFQGVLEVTFSEAWPAAQPCSSSKDSPSNEFPVLYPLHFLHWTLTNTAKEYMGNDFVHVCTQLFLHRLTQRAQGRWHHSHQSPQNGHLKPLSSALPHTDDTFASAVASSPWPETSACPEPSRSTQALSRGSHVNSHYSQTSSRALNPKCPHWFIHHILE